MENTKANHVLSEVTFYTVLVIYHAYTMQCYRYYLYITIAHGIILQLWKWHQHWETTYIITMTLIKYTNKFYKIVRIYILSLWQTQTIIMIIMTLLAFCRYQNI